MLLREVNFDLISRESDEGRTGRVIFGDFVDFVHVAPPAHADTRTRGGGNSVW